MKCTSVAYLAQRDDDQSLPQIARIDHLLHFQLGPCDQESPCIPPHSFRGVLPCLTPADVSPDLAELPRAVADASFAATFGYSRA